MVDYKLTFDVIFHQLCCKNNVTFIYIDIWIFFFDFFDFTSILNGFNELVFTDNHRETSFFFVSSIFTAPNIIHSQFCLFGLKIEFVGHTASAVFL